MWVQNVVTKSDIFLETSKDIMPLVIIYALSFYIFQTDFSNVEYSYSRYYGSMCTLFQQAYRPKPFSFTSLYSVCFMFVLYFKGEGISLLFYAWFHNTLLLS
jgi:hypothetical protein